MAVPGGGSGGAGRRVRAIDWLRGLVMVLMAVDHAGHFYDANHVSVMTDSGWGWRPGTALVAAEFLTRWITHLCAPTFVLLAGASLALSSERRRDRPGQTAFIVKRGLLIAALDPLWMSLGFAAYDMLVFQVLYAIGMSMVCMAFLRKLSTRALLVIAFTIQAFGELSKYVHPSTQPFIAIWRLLFVGGPLFRPAFVAYPLVPWLSFMIFGWVVGRWIVADRRRDNASRVRPLVLVGLASLALFVVVRGIDGYGNWDVHRDSIDLLQWLHVAKYPPSLAYTALELGLSFLALAFFLSLDDAHERPLLAPLGLLGSTAFFFYLLHIHILAAVGLLLQKLFGIGTETHGLLKTYGGAIAICVVLYPFCVLYRRYKTAHPDGWTRYI